MVQTRQPNIDRATNLVNEEISLVRTERNAFEAFRKRLSDVQASGSDTYQLAGGPAAFTVVDSSPQTELRQIREAYRETVMEVPHYDQEYGDTLAESVAEELGETLARHVVDGQVLTPAIRSGLVEATERVRDDRDDFIRLLRREGESLRSVASKLNDVETQLFELNGRIDATDTSASLARVDDTLQTVEQRCADLATSRQERIHNRSKPKLSGLDGDSLQGYLYDDMQTLTPALSDIASCLETVRHQRTRCLR